MKDLLEETFVIKQLNSQHRAGDEQCLGRKTGKRQRNDYFNVAISHDYINLEIWPYNVGL